MRLGSDREDWDPLHPSRHSPKAPLQTRLQTSSRRPFWLWGSGRRQTTTGEYPGAPPTPPGQPRASGVEAGKIFPDLVVPSAGKGSYSQIGGCPVLNQPYFVTPQTSPVEVPSSLYYHGLFSPLSSALIHALSELGPFSFFSDFQLCTWCTVGAERTCILQR